METFLGGAGPYTLLDGDFLKLSAEAAQGHVFGGWSDDFEGADNPVYFFLEEDRTTTATFLNVFTFTAELYHDDQPNTGALWVDPASAWLEHEDTTEIIEGQEIVVHPTEPLLL